MPAPSADDVPGDPTPISAPGDEPDPEHLRPPGATDATVEAAGKVSEAFEWIERARGRLYDLHQLVGRADFLVEDAADLLDEAGEGELADALRREVLGRNVLPGRWTFQVVEEFDRTYYRPVEAMEARVRDELMEGRRHVFESELKERRRSRGRAGHEARPGPEGAAGDGEAGPG